MSNKLPWDECVTMLSINPDAATREDVANMAAELVEMWGAAPDSGGMPETPNLDAALAGCVSGHISEWPAIRVELAKLKAYALSLLAENERLTQERNEIASHIAGSRATLVSDAKLVGQALLELDRLQQGRFEQRAEAAEREAMLAARSAGEEKP